MVFLKYPHYNDHESRRSAQEIIIKFIETSENLSLLSSFSLLVQNVANNKSSQSVSSLLNVLEWCNKVLIQFAPVYSSHQDSLKTLIIAQAKLVYKIVTIPTIEKRSRQYNSTVSSLRSTIAKSLTRSDFDSSPEFAQFFLETLIEKPNTPTDYVFRLISVAALAGAAIDVLPVKPGVQVKVEEKKDEIFTIYNQAILGTKVALPLTLVDTYSPLFIDFTSQSDFDNKIAPAVAKAFLRSPEIIMSTISITLFQKLSPLVDTADSLNSCLLSPLLSAFSSSKPNVRVYASQNLQALLALAQPTEKLSKVLTSIVTPLKTNKVTSHEQRFFYGEVLKSLNPYLEGSPIIYNNILTTVGKEVNEQSLIVLTEAFFKHLIFDLQSNAIIDKKVTEAIVKGMTDKKANLKRVWVTSFVGEIFNQPNSCSAELESFINSLSKPLIDSWKEVNTNPPGSILNKSTAIGFAVVALTSKLELLNPDLLKPYKEADVINNSLKNDKHSFLISHKTFTKLTEPADVEWAIRALKASAANVVDIDDSEIANDWALTWIYYITSPVSSTTSRLAISLLKDTYVSFQSFVGSLFISNIQQLLLDPTSKNDNNLSYIPKTKFNSIILALFRSNDKIDSSIFESNLVSLFVISHHPDVPIKGGWVTLCLESDMDPGAIVSAHSDRLLNSCFEMAELASNIGNEVMLEASLAAVTTLSFINPSLFVSRITSTIKEGLNTNDFTTELEPELVKKIWETPEGELAIDPFASKKTYVENKNTKDYETKKWEESVRKEIASKKGIKDNKPKYTKEQQATVNEQLKKETEIRSQLRSIYHRVHKLLVLITKLSDMAVTAYNGIEDWYPVSCKLLLDMLTTGKVNFIFKGEASRTFIKLSQNVASKLLLNLRDISGVAILRGLNATEVDSLALTTKEALKESVLSILYRIKFYSEKGKIDVISLIYLTPLLLRVLEGKGGIAASTEDESEEQTILALDIITDQADMFKEEVTSRMHLLTTLLGFLEAHPSKAKRIKDVLNRIVQSIGDSFNDDELQLFLKLTISSDPAIRTIILEIIDNELDISHLKYSSEIFIELFDENPTNAELAESIWTDNELEVDSSTPFKLLPFLESEDDSVRASAAQAIASAASRFPDLVPSVFNDLVDYFKEKSKPPVPVKDKYGVPVNLGDESDTWKPREGAAKAFSHLAPYLTNELIEKFFKFLIQEDGLGDANSHVREQIQEAGKTIIQAHGIKIVEILIPIFEDYLSKDIKKPTEVQDRIRESVVILYGALARHLKPSDPRAEKIVERLISTLDTPNEYVQYAVSECLADLVFLFSSKIGDYLQKLQDKLFNDSKYAHRRGAAYGISGIVKGCGIVALADYDIIRILIDAVEDKKDPKKRQGAQFAFETLSQSLGQYFEPYVFEIIPLILASLGDSSADVREATSFAAKQIMKHATGYGIKKLIPLTLESLDQTAWRAKKGAVELLGIMAYLDPRQLSTSLSVIIPELVGVLNDTHREVRSSANQSLQKFGEVIKNPEIQSLVPTLIKAISDPTKHTEEALDGLLKTQFIHYIDAPSLALVIHILHRGLKDRSANIKRKAAQIVGNMSILTDGKDLVPYLPDLVAELEISMVDPVPATRSTASRALGALVEKLGEDQFPDLIGRLMATLKSEDKVGDRLGSAQGLAEIVYGLGIRKLEELLPVILKNATSPKAHIREGFMPLMIFLPASFGASFTPYLSQIIPPILAGLSDDQSSIRETSLKAGRLLVKNYASKAVDLLLPELERGLSDYSHRIRAASVELTGDLLFQLTGVSGNTELAEEDKIIYGDVTKNIVEALGTERRDRIFAAIFICRSDIYPQVRGVAVEVWKSLVFNTPRTIKEILPTLTQTIIRRLASTNQDQRNIAAQALGELVRRVGSTSLSRLLPTLSEGMATSDPDARQGICIAVNELIGSTQPDDLEAQQGLIIPIIRSGLGDSDERVCDSAANAFDSLQNAIGNQIMDKILPDLINMLQNESTADNALAALKKIISTKGAIVFPVLMPTLLKPPMTVTNARSLGALASVAGPALIKRFEKIVDSLIDAIVGEDGEEPSEQDAETFKESLNSVLLSINFDEGVHTLMHHMLSLARNPEPKRREITFEHMSEYFSETSVDYSNYIEDWVGVCITSLDDVDPNVVKAAWQCLNSIIKAQSKEQLAALVRTARSTLRSTGTPGQELPGFALPKGASCILPIFLQGLMYGTNDQREQAALGISDVVERTSAANLKPFVTQITGPLIRTVGERFPSPIKAAIMYTLNTLLVKIPAFLKPFLPQLQRTFAKALADPTNETLRSRAGKALSTLVKLQPKVDPLVTELVTSANSTNDEAVVESILQSLSDIVIVAGSKLGPTSKSLISNFVEDELLKSGSHRRITLAKLVGGITNAMDGEEAKKYITSSVLNNSSNQQFAVLTLNTLLKVAGPKIDEAGVSKDIANYLIAHINDADDEISENSIRAAGKYLLATTATEEVAIGEELKNSSSPFTLEFRNIKLNFDHNPEIVLGLVKELAEAMVKSPSKSVETRRLALVVVRTLARHKYDMVCQYECLDILVPAIFGCVRDSVIPVKLAAEKAYLQIFKLTQELEENPEDKSKQQETFEKWFKHATEANVLPGTLGRSVSEYTKRVATRLASAEVERIAAGGDYTAVFSDRMEDEEDLWAIGSVELSIEEDI